jgi:hypothetical protein
MYAYGSWDRIGYVVPYPNITLDLEFLKVEAKVDVRPRDVNEKFSIVECLAILIPFKP